MGTLLTTGSILAAFFAGAVALFSPCCIVFLFPAYLAAAVKNRRWRLLPLTFLFALGLAVVLLPVTLGIGLVSSALTRYHPQLYLAGGALMLALAVLAFTGRSWSMPSFVRTPVVDRGDGGSVFALGVFSGVASSCCAPVLAGVMTLSALSSSAVGAASLGLAYVFGMVFPLFTMAVLWDRLRLGERKLLRPKIIRLRIAGRSIVTNTVNLAVAVSFAAMGTFVLALATTGDTTVAPGFQLAMGRWLSSAFDQVVRFLDPVPEPVLGLGLLALAAPFFLIAASGRRGRSTEGSGDEREDEGPGRPVREEVEAARGAPDCHPRGATEPAATEPAATEPAAPPRP